MTISPLTPAVAPQRQEALRRAAQELETVFLAEMLTSAGLGAPRGGGFGGGAGEGQFASFLVEEQARAMVAAGGIGLAESLFAALKEREA